MSTYTNRRTKGPGKISWYFFDMFFNTNSAPVSRAVKYKEAISGVHRLKLYTRLFFFCVPFSKTLKCGFAPKLADNIDVCILFEFLNIPHLKL